MKVRPLLAKAARPFDFAQGTRGAPSSVLRRGGIRRRAREDDLAVCSAMIFGRSETLPWVATDARTGRGLVERGQFDEIVLGNRLQVSSRLAPGSESADDHERVKSFFPQQMRHPGAGCFAHSSTVKIKILVLGEVLDFLLQVIGFDANGANDALGSRVVIAVAANVHNLHVAGIP